MGKEYKVHHPEFYPTGWMTAAKVSARATLAKPGEIKWISADWGKTANAATQRMKRLRAFGKGLVAHAEEYSDVRKAISAGYRIAFRKTEAFGVWDVQVGWKEASAVETLGKDLEMIVNGTGEGEGNGDTD